MAKKTKQNESPAVDSGSLGISGFTLGIMSIILAGWLGVFTAIVGFILCRVQQKNNPTKLGRIGIILNIIGFVLSVVLIIAYAFYLLPMVNQLG